MDIFSIPIYRESFRQFQKLTEERDDFRYEWKYNRIIGWINIFNISTTLKAELWFLDYKRIPVKFSQKGFINRGTICDITNVAYRNNRSIRDNLISFIEQIKCGGYGYDYLKKYHIYDTDILSFIKYIDFVKIITEEKVEAT